MFSADPEHFDVVFVANATAGIKLVLEAFSGHNQGFDYMYHRDSHTSLVGVRELAVRRHCFTSDSEVERWLSDKNRNPYEDKNNGEDRIALFAYPAQSNMNGRRLPLTWPSTLRSSTSLNHRNTYTLLDVAALVSTSPLDLSDPTIAPDFTVLSFYKIFGFPNLGALIVRKASAHVFDHRKYFGGGTTEMITCEGERGWVMRKEEKKGLHSRLEDGTGATHSILALKCAIESHKRLFGGPKDVSRHTGWLAKSLYESLRGMRHANGRLVCQIYKDPASTYGDASTQGATVAFNICKSDGSWVGSSKVGRLALEKSIHVRTGSLCNPAGMAHVLGLTASDVQRAYYSGFRCGQEYDVREGTPFGMVRVSFGAMSTLEDVEIFLKFFEECFVEKGPSMVREIQEKTNGGKISHSQQRSESFIEKPLSVEEKEKRPKWTFLRLCGLSRF